VEAYIRHVNVEVRFLVGVLCSTRGIDVMAAYLLAKQKVRVQFPYTPLSVPGVGSFKRREEVRDIPCGANPHAAVTRLP
jgi:hypothetical protein